MHAPGPARVAVGMAIALMMFSLRAEAQWSTSATGPAPRGGASTVVDAAGRLHVLGGFATSCLNSAVTTHDIYDPATGVWTSGAPLLVATGLAAAGLEPGGARIFVVAGRGSPNYLDDVQIYDVAANTWSAGADMPATTAFTHGDFGDDGRFYVIGGLDQPGGATGAVRIYDPATSTWSAGTPAPTSRLVAGVARGSDGRLYVVEGKAGGTGSGAISARVDIYDPVGDTWTIGAAAPVALANYGLAVTEDRGSLVVVGGSLGASTFGAPYRGDVLVYAVATDRWGTLPSLPNTRANVAAGVSGGVLSVMGGYNGTLQGEHLTMAIDADDDGVANPVDNCPFLANAAQADGDADFLGDACDAIDDLDVDGDTVDNATDNCPFVANLDQADADADGLGDACDGSDGLDADGDTVDNLDDNCPFVANLDQADADADGLGDVCDTADGLDVDGDGVGNATDNCPFTANADQADDDADGLGDVCDDADGRDADGDAVDNVNDNCPFTANPGQADADGDGLGDACDDTDGTDLDGDGVTNDVDSCPFVANADDADADADGLGDACDDTDGADLDGDGVANQADNCPFLANAGQADADADGLGDACDPSAEPVADDVGCCAVSNRGAGGWALLALFTLVALRRRRRSQPRSCRVSPRPAVSTRPRGRAPTCAGTVPHARRLVSLRRAHAPARHRARAGRSAGARLRLHVLRQAPAALHLRPGRPRHDPRRRRGAPDPLPLRPEARRLPALRGLRRLRRGVRARSSRRARPRGRQPRRARARRRLRRRSRRVHRLRHRGHRDTHRATRQGLDAGDADRRRVSRVGVSGGACLVWIRCAAWRETPRWRCAIPCVASQRAPCVWTAPRPTRRSARASRRAASRCGLPHVRCRRSPATDASLPAPPADRTPQGGVRRRGARPASRLAGGRPPARARPAPRAQAPRRPRDPCRARPEP